MYQGYLNQKPQLCWQILHFLKKTVSEFTSTSDPLNTVSHWNFLIY